jgi:glycosyltransferase involved in cell wall biosynthesis
MLKPFWHALDTYNPLMAREIASILDEERPDLVHTHTLVGFSTLSWHIVKQRELPLVHTLHDYYLMCPKATMFRDGKNCQGRCAQCLPFSLPRRRHTNQVDVVTGVSKFTLERHLQYDFFSNTPERRVIYNGFKVEAEPSTSRPGSRSLPIRFGYLGRLDPTKGIENLLISVNTLPAGSWSLKIGGRGPTGYMDHLRATYGSPDIEFLGYVAANDFFEEIDVLVVPSVWHEPSGRVISEAFAHGVPVLGSNRGGIPELIDDGNTGFLFEPDLSNDLAQKLNKFIDYPALTNDMRGSCLEKAASLLPKNIMSQYLEMYADVAGGL